ncbi:type IVB secretion system protein IcmX [Legionella bononiensis]|uniref:Type IV secretion protein IcmX n=1 Tax=Legionella bononiensis TaxID=2793102 RepID=A0ABS1W9T1_9GAMM|nr:type IVB secretion system protein IcmX [Legionella bononiensis]MBL7480688.1 type IV secretion protein IcmX [Legionella bononiensis]MBL7526113.1 type IV secretion protein IcmX [Legionella bononiensis]MBL7563392.1 type IV secretion protein IcmX [Legionella bononiensis]
MKLLSKCSLVTLFCLTSYSVVVTATDNIMDVPAPSTNDSDLTKYLKNLGNFLGFDLTTKSPPTPPENYTAALLNEVDASLFQSYVFSTFFGAIPVNAMNQIVQQFVPTSIAGADGINKLANTTFKNYAGDSTSDNTSVTASPLLDQPTSNKGSYLPDPVSQAIFNILGTPDFTYCMNNDASAWNKGECQYKYQDKVIYNTAGNIPKVTEYFSYDYNQKFITQLNSNSLIAPLLYSNDQIPSSGTPIGLSAQNQAQLANNFIRYASGQVSPLSLPKWKDYGDLYKLATDNAGANPPNAQQMQAQATLSSYFNNLRVYAAQSSVGISNLYYIMSKRLPQEQPSVGGNSSQVVSSQALSEFNMATWRILNPKAQTGKDGIPTQWMQQLDTASSATIQKEIAVLLAEINYQMYLDRQLQERILLTNTIMLMQNLKASEPSADFSTQGSDAESTTQDTSE